MIKEFKLRTDPENFHNITRTVRDAVCDSGIVNGTCLVY